MKWILSSEWSCSEQQTRVQTRKATSGSASSTGSKLLHWKIKSPHTLSLRIHFYCFDRYFRLPQTKQEYLTAILKCSHDNKVREYFPFSNSSACYLFPLNQSLTVLLYFEQTTTTTRTLPAIIKLTGFIFPPSQTFHRHWDCALCF